jgi:hypothetical protein
MPDMPRAKVKNSLNDVAAVRPLKVPYELQVKLRFNLLVVLLRPKFSRQTLYVRRLTCDSSSKPRLCKYSWRSIAKTWLRSLIPVLPFSKRRFKTISFVPIGWNAPTFMGRFPRSNIRPTLCRPSVFLTLLLTWRKCHRNPCRFPGRTLSCCSAPLKRILRPSRRGPSSSGTARLPI